MNICSNIGARHCTAATMVLDPVLPPKTQAHSPARQRLEWRRSSDSSNVPELRPAQFRNTRYFAELLNVTFNVQLFPGANVNLLTFTFPDSTHTIC